MTTIALAGKGGSGKTTMAGLIVDWLVKKDRGPVLAIDADPNSNLNDVLGVKCERTVVSIVNEVMEKKEELPAGITKERLLEFHFQEALVECRGFDLLAMGRTESAGCYCRANHLLRGFMEKLTHNYGYTVMDNEAGMEHLSRRTTRDVDVLMMIANPTPVSYKSAMRIYETAQKLELNVKKSCLVINEIGAGLSWKEESTDLEVLGKVPYDDELLKASVHGKSIFDLADNSLAKKAVNGIMGKLGI